MLVPTLAAMNAWVVDVTADSTWLGGAMVGLYQNQMTPTINTKLSDLVEANFDGYARKASHTWSSPFIDDNGIVCAQAQQLVFTPTGSSTMNTCFGLFVTGSDTTKLLAVEPFDQSQPLTGPSSNITITLRCGFDSKGNFGFSIVV